VLHCQIDREANEIAHQRRGDESLIGGLVGPLRPQQLAATIDQEDADVAPRLLLEEGLHRAEPHHTLNEEPRYRGRRLAHRDRQHREGPVVVGSCHQAIDIAAAAHRLGESLRQRLFGRSADRSRHELRPPSGRRQEA
jgi:hypothetical protein